MSPKKELNKLSNWMKEDEDIHKPFHRCSDALIKLLDLRDEIKKFKENK
jgi:hypothetical protein